MKLVLCLEKSYWGVDKDKEKGKRFRLQDMQLNCHSFPRLQSLNYAVEMLSAGGLHSVLHLNFETGIKYLYRLEALCHEQA